MNVTSLPQLTDQEFELFLSSLAFDPPDLSYPTVADILGTDMACELGYPPTVLIDATTPPLQPESKIEQSYELYPFNPEAAHQLPHPEVENPYSDYNDIKSSPLSEQLEVEKPYQQSQGTIHQCQCMEKVKEDLKKVIARLSDLEALEPWVITTTETLNTIITRLGWSVPEEDLEQRALKRRKLNISGDK
ncbi:hypothetical protein BDD12DRAFT_871559 [Trichophaea hybrida]|nr:hypothetical protein BDD12DRAFT_871559 [Trichophaea hybrida]